MTETNKDNSRNYQPKRRTRVMASLAALASAAGLVGAAGSASAAEQKVNSADKIELAAGKPNPFEFKGSDKKLAKEWEMKFRNKAKELKDLDKSGNVRIFPGAVQIKMTGMMHLASKDQPIIPNYMLYYGPNSPNNLTGFLNLPRAFEQPRFAKIHGVDCMIVFDEADAKADPSWVKNGSKEADYSAMGPAAAQTIIPIPELNALVEKGLIQIQLWGSKIDTNPPLVKQSIVNGHYFMNDYPRTGTATGLKNHQIGMVDDFLKMNNEQLDAGQGTIDVDEGGAEGFLYDMGYIGLPSTYKNPMGLNMTRNQQY